MIKLSHYNDLYPEMMIIFVMVSPSLKAAVRRIVQLAFAVSSCPRVHVLISSGGLGETRSRFCPLYFFASVNHCEINATAGFRKSYRIRQSEIPASDHDTNDNIYDLK